MLTGTPLDLTPFGVIFANISLIYWGFAFICLLVALIWPRKLRFRYRLISAVTVIVLFLINPVHDFLYNYPQRKADVLRMQAAIAYFNYRCDHDAGIKIYRTADNVDSLLLMKVRPTMSPSDEQDILYPGAAFGRESGENGYIASFLSGEWMYTEESSLGQFSRRKKLLNYPAERGKHVSPPRSIEESQETLPGYQYVDVMLASEDNHRPFLRYRYTYDVNFRLVKELTSAIPPRYAVTFEDSLDPLDRLHWVAGSTVKVLDTQTNETMATFTRYTISPRLGSQISNGSPWFEANRPGLECPPTPKNSPHGFELHQTRYFVDQVLQPAPWNPDLKHLYKQEALLHKSCLGSVR